MAVILCKICGGKIDVPSGITIGECPYCHTVTTFPRFVAPDLEALYRQAEEARLSCNFDKAISVYEEIISRNTSDPEIYWGLVLSSWGIEYVEDPLTKERKPTCHRVQYESILDDVNFIKALEIAEIEQAEIYKQEAMKIAEIQKRYSTKQQNITVKSIRPNPKRLTRLVLFHLLVTVFLLLGGWLYLRFQSNRRSPTESEYKILDSKDSEDKIIDFGGVSLKMIKVKAGKFQMGSPEGELGRRSNEQQHWVKLTQDYWLGETEVTQKQWMAIMEAKSFKRNSAEPIDTIDYPVDSVSWEQAMTFCDKLNLLFDKEKPLGYEFSLPTEAQWEYACRANTKTSLNNGTNLTSTHEKNENLEKVGWYHSISSSISSRNHAMPIGRKLPNKWGFYDMHGNVAEWCYDLYRKYNGDAIDPVGTMDDATYENNNKVIRGGCIADPPDICRSANRFSGKHPLNGFRLAIVPIREKVILREKDILELKAAALKAIEYKVLDLSGVPLKMIKVKAGKFLDRKLGNHKNEQQHWVEVIQDYWLGETEVTQKQWVAIMGTNPSRGSDDGGEIHPALRGSMETNSSRKAIFDISFYGNYPVDSISWIEAKDFCDKLNLLLSKECPQGYKFSLPTTAQWEYACRSRLSKVGENYGEKWCSDIQKSNDSSYCYFTHPVAQRLPNNWGLYDMLGNVWEMCDDGGINGGIKYKFIRGGSIVTQADCCFPWIQEKITLTDERTGEPKSSLWTSEFPWNVYYGHAKDIGFRLALIPMLKDEVTKQSEANNN